MDPYLLLAVAEGCGPGLVAALLDPHADPAALLRDPPPLPPAVLARLRSQALPRVARSWVERAAALGCTVLTPSDERYPDRLRRAPLRPNALFGKGDLRALDPAVRSLCIVGSRTHSAYGDAATRDFGGAAARAGVAIWSGLAHGIDALAHEAALRHGAPTVAVLAGGLDRIYPRDHADLAAQIAAAGGLLLSEVPPGLSARRGHFPRRNRIMAAGAEAVLVVEAGLKSGTLHTARFAADAGVPVFAVPGPYTSPRSLGCHALLAEGAQVAASPEELLRDLGVATSLRAGDGEALRLSADEEAVLRVLAHGPRPMDLVQREARLAPDRFLGAVLSLTDQGRIRTAAGDLLALA